MKLSQHFEKQGAASAPVACARAWARATALAALVEYTLAQIEQALTDGALRAFSAGELSALVRALFEESDERATLLAAIERAR